MSFNVQVVLDLAGNLKARAKEATGALKEVGREADGLAGAATGARKLGEQVRDVAKDAKHLAKNLKDAGDEASKAGRRSFRSMVRDMRQAARESATVKHRIEGVERAAHGLGTALRGGVAQMRALAAGALNVGRHMGKWAWWGVGAAGITSALSLAGGIKLATGYATEVDEQNDRAKRVGMDLNAYRRWQFVGSRGGMDADTFQRALETFSNNLGQAADPKMRGPLAAFLKNTNPKLLANLRKADTDTALRIMLDAISREKSASVRSAAARAAFGEPGAKAIVMAEGGPDQLAKEMATADKLMAHISAAEADAAGDFNDTFDDFKTALKSVRDEIGKTLLPSINEMLGDLREWVTANREVIASGFSDWVKGIIDTARAVDWKGMADGIREFRDSIVGFKDFFGGWGKTAGLVAGVFFLPRLVAIGKALWEVGKALTFVGTAAGAAAARAGLGGAAGAAAGAAGAAGSAGAATGAATVAGAVAGGAGTGLLSKMLRIGGLVVLGQMMVKDLQLTPEQRLQFSNESAAAYKRAEDAVDQSSFGKAWTWMKSWFHDVDEGTAKAAGDVKTNTEKTLGSMDLTGVAKTAMGGFAKGIQDGGTGAVAAAKGVAAQVRGALEAGMAVTPSMPVPQVTPASPAAAKATTINQTNTYHINGASSPEAVARAVGRQQSRDIQKAKAGALHDGVLPK